MEIRRAAQLQYHGQTFELTVPVADGPITAAAVAAIEEAFGREHEKTYGHRAGPEEPVEIVAIQVVGRGLPDRPTVPQRLRPSRAAPPDGGDSRRAYFGPEHGWLETPLKARADLAAGAVGPCIIEEYDATTVVPPGARVGLDGFTNMIITL
jgi:N-methylhydantoinase A